MTDHATDEIDPSTLLDSEILEIEKVMEAIRLRAERSVEYDAFQREIKERFIRIGFIVDVAWYTAGRPDNTLEPGLLIPEITLQRRVEKKVFDYDQQVAEVTGDILDLGQKGVIKTNDGLREKMMEAKNHKH
jgi:hypothetical protein